jgi:AmiR/NasT family two-component response regulator
MVFSGDAWQNEYKRVLKLLNECHLNAAATKELICARYYVDGLEDLGLKDLLDLSRYLSNNRKAMKLENYRRKIERFKGI